MTNQTGKPNRPQRVVGSRLLIVMVIAAIAAVIGLALLVNIVERKQEARNPFFRVVELTDDTDDPAVWGKNFPLQYTRSAITMSAVPCSTSTTPARPATNGRSRNF
jgi:nitrite reductase (cytochrome c-552)